MAQPRANFDSTVLDLGVIQSDETATAPVGIENTGNEPLRIEGAISSCPCVRAELPEPQVVAPAAAFDLPIVYQPDGNIGPRSASLAVYTNDPEMPAVVVEVAVVVESLVRVIPPDGLAWSIASRGATLPKSLVLESGIGGEPLEVVALDTDVDGVVPRAVLLPDPGGGVEVFFDLAGTLPLGPLATTLRAQVRVGDEGALVEVPLRGEIIGDVMVTPPAIISPKTGYMAGDPISTITVRSSLGGAPPTLLGAIAVGPIRAVVETSGDASAHSIAVHAGDNGTQGPQSGTVYVMTASADQPIVEVPIYYKRAALVRAEPARLVLAPDTEASVELVAVRPEQAATIVDLRYETNVLAVEQEPSRVRVRSRAVATKDVRSTLLGIALDNGEQLYVPVLILDSGGGE